MAKEKLNLLQFAATTMAQAGANAALMPHAALAQLCRMPDHAESPDQSSHGRFAGRRPCGIIRKRCRTVILRECNQSLIPNSLSAFVSDRWRHISMSTSRESSKMDSCRRRCPARLTPSRGSANGFSSKIFGWRISMRSECDDFWTAILVSCTSLNLQADPLAVRPAGWCPALRRCRHTEGWPPDLRIGGVGQYPGASH
jgi:hypothetical protein